MEWFREGASGRSGGPVPDRRWMKTPASYPRGTGRYARFKPPTLKDCPLISSKRRPRTTVAGRLAEPLPWPTSRSPWSQDAETEHATRPPLLGSGASVSIYLRSKIVPPARQWRRLGTIPLVKAVETSLPYEKENRHGFPER